MEPVNATQKWQERLPNEPDAAPECEYYGICGGCDLQHWSYERQLAFKEDRVRKIFQKFKDVTFHKVVPSPRAYGYRNRVTLHSDGKEFGFYKKNSHDVVAVKSCAIASAAVNEKIKSLQTLAAGDFEVREDDLRAAFIQINAQQNENLIATVTSAARGRKSRRVLELYCGAGNLSFPLSEIAREVVAIEGIAVAVSAAEVRRITEKNKRIKFVHGDVFQEVYKLTHDYQNFDVVVCDPPREGLRGVAALLPKLAPEKIIAVSCEPNTLARDGDVLQDKGYRLAEVTPLDMFPQTRHVEVVAVFVKES